MFEAKRVTEPNLFSVLIPENSIYCGIHLNTISLPERCAVLGVLRNGQVISTENNPAIAVGDYILAMALHPMMTPALKVLLKRTHPVYYSLNSCLLELKPELLNPANESYSNQVMKFTSTW